MKYVWLNINTGKFSNSWDEKTYNDAKKRGLFDNISPGWKLIKYESLNDSEFEFYNMMKLK